jgi:hypothetical protein
VAFYQLGLFNNDDNTSDYIAPDGEMIKEESSGNAMEENDLDLLRGVMPHSAWRNLRITSAW